ncbi:hypothetical protein JS756_04810 [Streptomyces actuosus]|uniref:Uncharacterized protein n=1 Tax=Streptomyces actuosus TaxID=1885 RepID=A0ABS2VK57_STRAS|nr:hypothetical protein [Streptomyces actuosus]MBN0043431.1 hypothetical protein [Streptomyces actuosus]
MPGTVLLLAAAPAGKGRLVDAASVLPVLAAVPPAVLAGTDTANVVELADPLEPQAVLTRLRAAAAATGPLTVYVTGQLHLDRRQRLPHLALARTTPATVRYTGFPWHWFRDELRLRPAGSTCLLLDLHADAESWQWLRGGAVLDCGAGHAVHGRIAPPPGRWTLGTPAYMRTAATVLRSGRRPATAALHQQVLDRLGGETAGDLVLAHPGGPSGVPGPAAAPGATDPNGTPGSVGTPGVPAAPTVPAFPEVPGPRPASAAPDPHASLTAAVQAGRHADADALAARLEEEAARAHGPGSDQALHWAEVRADLAMLAGDAARSCRTWLAVAGARLAAGQAADAPQVEAAADRAHHQWSAVRDPARARELGLALAELRGRVPGRRRGALDHVRRQLRELQTQH